MPFEAPIQFPLSEFGILVDDQQFLASSELNLLIRGDEVDAQIEVKIQAGSRISISSKDRENRATVIFRDDFPLRYVSLEQTPEAEIGVEEWARSALPDDWRARDLVYVEIEGPLPPLGDPLVDYAVCVAVGVARDIIVAVQDCRKQGNESISDLIKCLKNKGIDIGIGVLSHLLRCLIKVARFGTI